MNKKKKLKLKDVLKKIFPNNIIPKKILNLKINDLKGWDSLGNFNLLLLIEDVYDVRFTQNEMSTITSCKEIIKYLKKHGRKF
jgi:acyl carrier protein